MNHLRADPQPSTTIRQFFIRSVWVYFKAQCATVKIEGTFKVFAENSYVMNTVE
jgi:hypothetical protein